MGKIPNFTDSELFETPKTDCVLKFYKDEGLSTLKIQDSQALNYLPSYYKLELAAAMHIRLQMHQQGQDHRDQEKQIFIATVLLAAV